MHTVPRDDLALCQNGRYVRRIPGLDPFERAARMAETRQEARGPGLYDPRNEHDSCGIGFVANIKGRKSHDIIARGLEILVNLDHRGAVGADPLMGDGAGCLIQTPDTLLRDWAEGRGLTLPPPGRYAVAMCFLPWGERARAIAVAHVEHFIHAEGQTLVGWRDVPTDTTGLGARVI